MLCMGFGEMLCTGVREMLCTGFGEMLCTGFGEMLGISYWAVQTLKSLGICLGGWEFCLQGFQSANSIHTINLFTSALFTVNTMWTN